MKRGFRIPKSLFSRAQCLEIGSRFGNNASIETHFDAAEGFAIGSNVEIDFVGNVGGGGSSSSKEVGEEVHLELGFGGGVCGLGGGEVRVVDGTGEGSGGGWGDGCECGGLAGDAEEEEWEG